MMLLCFAFEVLLQKITSPSFPCNDYKGSLQLFAWVSISLCWSKSFRTCSISLIQRMWKITTILCLTLTLLFNQFEGNCIIKKIIFFKPPGLLCEMRHQFKVFDYVYFLLYSSFHCFFHHVNLAHKIND